MKSSSKFVCPATQTDAWAASCAAAPPGFCASGPDLQGVPSDLRQVTKILTENYTDGLADLNLQSGAYAVIATHSHELDFQILKAILEAGNKPAYIGVIASAKKSAAMVARLKEELASTPDLGNLYMPVGLDIGGQSPDEIAFSILAEIQAHRHGKEGHKHMRGNWKEK